MCAHGLSSLIRSYERRKLLHHCKVAQGAPIISHILFADDSYIYCRATLEETYRMVEMLKLFECVAGKKNNFDKSSVYFKNTRLDDKEDVLDKLEMR